eukprot:3005211-Rhodomonas_salina.1
MCEGAKGGSPEMYGIPPKCAVWPYNLSLGCCAKFGRKLCSGATAGAVPGYSWTGCTGGTVLSCFSRGQGRGNTALPVGIPTGSQTRETTQFGPIAENSCRAKTKISSHPQSDNVCACVVRPYVPGYQRRKRPKGSIFELNRATTVVQPKAVRGRPRVPHFSRLPLGRYPVRP